MTIEKDIRENFAKSFDIFKENFVGLILGTLIAMIGMIFIVTIAPLVFGLAWMCIEVTKGKKVKATDVFKGFDYFMTSWGLLLLGGLAILGGLLLLVIPGLLLMVLYQYAVTIAITEKTGAVESLKRSYHRAKEHFSFSAVLWILLAILGSIGGFTRIGVLVTVPFSMIAIVLATKTVTAKKK